MDVVQKQVLELSDKVDTLHALLEQLTKQVSGIASVQKASLNGASSRSESLSGASLKGANGTPLEGMRAPDTGLVNVSPMTMQRTVNPTMVHKDVLSDEPNLDGEKSNSSANLSPEVQIQRLTAQLTAAYNRMAALEEQILACRFQ